MTQTPMQELLQWLREKELTPTADHIRRVFLEKEREFAEKCFDSAVKIAEDNVHWDKDEQCKEADYSMIEKEKTYFLNQLYPKP